MRRIVFLENVRNDLGSIFRSKNVSFFLSDLRTLFYEPANPLESNLASLLEIGTHVLGFIYSIFGVC